MSLRKAYGEEEWNFIVKVGKSMNDPEERAAFKQMVLAKKQADPAYSIFSDFPRADSMQICKDIIKALAAVNAKIIEKNKTWTPRRAKKQEMLSRLFGELVLQGFHNPPKEENPGIE